MTDNAFTSLDLDQPWIENLNNLGYTEMTPIQQAALPELLAGGDVMGHASTGTGKTVAFGLALLSNVVPESKWPRALVLCPARELARQVAEEIRKLAWALPNTNVLTLTGGEPFRKQHASLSGGCDVVVGTPGRVFHHLRRETLKLHDVETLVLDEADRMVDMGFIDDVSEIIDHTPGDRQTIFMSATMSDEIHDISRRLQDDATFISVVDEEPNPDISQMVYDIGDLERTEALERVLGKHRPDSSVIFCNRRATCNEVVQSLRDAGHSAQTIHGGLDQRDRDGVMEMFKNGSVRHMVATNVAARGIDVDEVEAVINYVLPEDTSAYRHRIGRTGRAGDEGVAVSLVALDDADRDWLARYDEELAKVESRPAAGLPDRTQVRPPQPADNKTVAIKGGKKDKLRPGDIVGALTGDIGIPNDTIGLITIRDHIAFVAIERTYADEALEGIEREQVKGRDFGAFLLR